MTMWIYIIVSCILWFTFFIMMLVYAIAAEWTKFLWSTLAFFGYPILLEMFLNVWGFWAMAQPYPYRKRIKDWHFPIVFSDEYDTYSYFNMQWSFHQQDWRTPRHVFIKLKSLGLISEITPEERSAIEDMEAEGIGFDQYVAMRQSGNNRWDDEVNNPALYQAVDRPWEELELGGGQDIGGKTPPREVPDNPNPNPDPNPGGTDRPQNEGGEPEDSDDYEGGDDEDKREEDKKEDRKENRKEEDKKEEDKKEDRKDNRPNNGRREEEETPADRERRERRERL